VGTGLGHCILNFFCLSNTGLLLGIRFTVCGGGGLVSDFGAADAAKEVNFFCLSNTGLLLGLLLFTVCGRGGLVVDFAAAEGLSFKACCSFNFGFTKIGDNGVGSRAVNPLSIVNFFCLSNIGLLLDPMRFTVCGWACIVADFAADDRNMEMFNQVVYGSQMGFV
jgi:hypothetical protein